MKCPNTKCNYEERDDGKCCFNCFMCKAHQAYMPEGIRGGITENEAMLVGWVRVDGEEWKWLCPNCSGNKEKLDKVFDG